MLETLTVVLLGLVLVAIALLIVILVRPPRPDLSCLEARLDLLGAGQERTERGVRDELGRIRDESSRQGRELREEVSRTLIQLGETLATLTRDASGAQTARMQEFAASQSGELTAFASRLTDVSEAYERRMETLRATVEQRLRSLQEDNAARLEQMRQTVDERLQGTLELRLGESFRTVSERLEQVHRGLGEMQALASGVGDLKRVLTNIKTRGTWGEIQLGALLDQVLTPGQYEANVATRDGSADRVEFAIRLPGPDGRGGRAVYLPIDAKFPQEDYQRLVEAADRGDAEGVEVAARQLEQRIRASAREIHDKYLEPPHTTDFGILFLPTEGLYAEVLRRPGLADALQRDTRVVVAGPTTLWALLNSLQMGFRTLAIERRSSEVWEILGSVRTQFSKLGDLVDAVRKKIQEASHKMEAVARQGRTIQRRLRDVQELPASSSWPPLLEPADNTATPTSDAPTSGEGDDPDRLSQSG